MMRKLLFSALISGLLFPAASAQTIKKTLALGDSFASAKEYDKAIAFYERVRFFGPGDSLFSYLGPALGRVYFAKGDYEKSAKEYSSLGFFAHDSSTYDLLFEKTKAEIFAKRYDLAEKTLTLIDTYLYKTFRDERIFYTGVLHYTALSFDLAKYEFLKLADSDAERKEMEHLFQKLRRSENRKPMAAFLLSALLPGTGQVYAGRVEDGINTFLLTGAWVALTVSTHNIYGSVHALATTFPWLLRYYMSGAENAMILTMKMKKKKRETVYRKLLDVVAE